MKFPITYTEFRLFFTTIAVLLGTGILGLPVTLVDSGFFPFFIVFSLVFVMQIIIVFIATSLLEHTHVILHHQSLSDNNTSSVGPSSPDLHTMGRLFLSPLAARCFDLAVLLTFISTLISYALAGATAFSQLLNTNLVNVLIPFVLVCTFGIIFAAKYIQPLVSVLTLIKVLVLGIIITLCGVVSNDIHLRPHENWADILQPFLVSTVAIGGIADLMPVMFESVAYTPQSIRRFRYAIIAGVGACYILNLCWSSFVLGIVPQTIQDAEKLGLTISLEQAANAGEIATVPVSQVLKSRYGDKYGWLAQVITIFITLSITVSFNAIGLGLRHVLDGVVQALQIFTHTSADIEQMMVQNNDSKQDYLSIFMIHVKQRFIQGIVYTIMYGMVLGVAVANPSGFLLVLETFTSMALNMAGGVYVALMFISAREKYKAINMNRNVPKVESKDVTMKTDETTTITQNIPAASASNTTTATNDVDLVLPLSPQQGTICALLILISFGVAVLYDIHQAICKVLPSIAGGWITGMACILLWNTAIKPVLRTLFKNEDKVLSIHTIPSDGYSVAGLTHAHKDSVHENTSLLAVSARAHANLGTNTAVTSFSAVGSAAEKSSNQDVTFMESLRDFLWSNIYTFYDMVLFGTVAWTHAGIDSGILNLSLTILSILSVLIHQIIFYSDENTRGISTMVHETTIIILNVLLHRVTGIRQYHGTWFRWLCTLLIIFIDGIGCIVISGLSFDEGQIASGCIQLILAVFSIRRLVRSIQAIE